MEILYEFCVCREEMYANRRNLIIRNLENDIRLNERKKIWISGIVSNSIQLPLENDNNLRIENLEPPYEDLLQISCRQFQRANITKLEQKILDLRDQLSRILKTTPRKLWQYDLEAWFNFYFGSGKRSADTVEEKSETKRLKQ